MSWKRWPWLNDAVLPLAMISLRVCWLWLWLGLLQRLLAPSYQGTLLPAWLIAGLLLASQAATSWIMRRTGSLALARLAIAGLGLFMTFLVLWWQFYRLHYPLWDWRWPGLWAHETLFWSGEVPPSTIALPAVVYLWLRGIRESSRRLERRHVMRALFAGCLALAIFVPVAAALESGLPAAAGGLILLFFAMAMIALALSGLNLAPVSEPGQAGPARFFNRYWLGSVLTVIAGLLALALFFILLVSPETVAQLPELVWGVLSEVLILLILVVSILLSPVLYLLSRLLAGAGPFVEPEIPELAPPPLVQDGPLDRLAAAIERLPQEWQWVALLPLILAIALLFALVLRRLLAAEKEEIEETRELIFSRELLLAQLAQLWPAWLNQLGRRRSAPVDPFLSLAGELDTRRLIREAYQALLAAASERGLARNRPQTPLEYRDELARSLPEESKPLAIITEKYVQARYDLEPPTPAAAEQVRQAWQRLQIALSKQPHDE